MVAVKELFYSINGENIINGVDLRAERGITCLLGESGCGKTTLLRLIAGLIQPDSGLIETSGRVCMLFQEDRLFPWLTAEQNVAMVMDKINKADRNRAREYLELMGLKDAAGLSPAQLSGGMQRRVSFAAMMAFNADICLLDEPVRGLDGKSAEVMLTRIKALGAQKTLIMVTHSLTEAQGLTDKIYFMERGHVRESD